MHYCVAEGHVPGSGPTRYMSAATLMDFPQPEADHVIAYGDEPLQFGELRLPDGEGPFPVIVLIRFHQPYDRRRIGCFEAHIKKRLAALDSFNVKLRISTTLPQTRYHLVWKSREIPCFEY
ncbi:MAG: hypothetical protein QNK34_08120 [Woeseiaceae bacterium]|nr:hypothetical protein [Woeseiaceae bacterium]